MIKKRRRFNQEMAIRRKPPASPLLLQTGLTSLSSATPTKDILQWTLSLELLYIQYYGDGCLGWTFDHMHLFDQAATEAMDGILAAGNSGDIDPELIAPFAQTTWRCNYSL